MLMLMVLQAQDSRSGKFDCSSPNGGFLVSLEVLWISEMMPAHVRELILLLCLGLHAQSEVETKHFRCLWLLHNEVVT
jgi:hypothetical protein